MVRVTPSGSSTKAALQRATSPAIARSGSGSCERALELGVGDRVGLARLVAAGVADGLLAFAVAPAGAVGDQLALVAGEQVADDRLERLQLRVGGVDQAGAQVVAEPEVRARRLDLAGARVGALRAVLLAGRAQLGVVEAGAGEVALLARDGAVAGFELLADRVEHEHGVDDPDAGGEVGAALVHVGVAAGAGALAQRAVDAQLARRRPGAGGERVELAVELVGRAVEDAGELSPVGRGQLGAGARDLLDGVEQRAVVDAHGVGVLVLDQRAVHEGAEVAQRAVVQLRAGDARRDRRR